MHMIVNWNSLEEEIYDIYDIVFYIYDITLDIRYYIYDIAVFHLTDVCYEFFLTWCRFSIEQQFDIPEVKCYVNAV